MGLFRPPFLTFLGQFDGSAYWTWQSPQNYRMNSYPRNLPENA